MRKRRLILSEESSDGEMEAVTLNQASAAEEVQWTWKRDALQMTKLCIVLYSKRFIVEHIAEELKLIGDGVYQEFLNSCFGFLMRFDTQGVTCKSALRCLFAHEVVKADAGPDELWYRVGGRFIRFSKYEYALVTGLSFRPTAFDPSAEHHPPASGLYSRHYRGRRLKMNTLRRDFTDGVFRGSPADALKVAKLLIVYYLLFGMDGKQRCIDEWAWTLIEDSDGWETFMWGKYTYQILLRYLQRVPTELPNSKAASYRLHGYAWAFLIWAFEAIPELGNACGVPTSDDVLPRCLRWRFQTKNQVDMGGLYDRQMEVQSTLEPSAKEQRKSYWEHIHDDLQSGVCYVHPDTRSKKKTASASPVSRKLKRTDRLTTRADQENVPGLSNATPTQCSSSNSANSMKSKKKCKRTHPLTICADQEKAQKRLSVHECGRRDEMTSVIQKKLPALVRQELPSVIHLALKEFLSKRDPAVRGTSSSMLIARPREKNLSLSMDSEIANSEEQRNLDIPDKKGEKDKSDNGPNGSMPDGAENVVTMSRGVSSTSNSSGSRSSGLSRKGDRNSVQPWTREVDDEHNTVKTFRGSQSRNDPPEEESNDTVKDNKHREPRASGLSKQDYYNGCALAEYLIDGGKELRLRKSVSEVKKERPDVIGQCRKLATIYVEKLFQIYSTADDPFFGQS
ncbi:hypothetical protein PHJA_000396100 [Phtheirospermum japonicum]|uniref:DUF1985 domain-containing protein n=1 Tax=Phtheirospermum japonicum TaxID=374723 RepID=A0A830BKB1_9LAMI|nr:hypothetical protein PHJA_000396100 [Phtheirospermum japonicum]